MVVILLRLEESADLPVLIELTDSSLELNLLINNCSLRSHHIFTALNCKFESFKIMFFGQHVGSSWTKN